MALSVSILSILLGACGSNIGSATDDIRAVYSGADGAFEMTVEYSSEGQLRARTTGQDMWLLRNEGVNYFIIPREDGADVLDLRVVSKLIQDALPESLSMGESARLTLRKEGPTEVNGRMGTGYRFAGSPQHGAYSAVISADPALDRLGEAMYEQFKSSIELNPLVGSSAEAMLEILATGTPISFAGADLSLCEITELEPSIFELPGKPLDDEESRELMIDRNMLPREKPQVSDLPRQ